eukprot:ctg_681.g361
MPPVRPAAHRQSPPAAPRRPRWSAATPNCPASTAVRRHREGHRPHCTASPSAPASAGRPRRVPHAGSVWRSSSSPPPPPPLATPPDGAAQRHRADRRRSPCSRRIAGRTRYPNNGRRPGAAMLATTQRA